MNLVIRHNQVNLFGAVDPTFIKTAVARRVIVTEKTFADRVRESGPTGICGHV